MEATVTFCSVYTTLQGVSPPVAPESRLNDPVSPLFNNLSILISTYSSDLMYSASPSVCVYCSSLLSQHYLFICLVFRTESCRCEASVLVWLSSILCLFICYFSLHCKSVYVANNTLVCVADRGVAACLSLVANQARLQPCQHHLTHTSLGLRLSPALHHSPRLTVPPFVSIHPFLSTSFWTTSKVQRPAVSSAGGEWKLRLIQKWRKLTGRELCYF